MNCEQALPLISAQLDGAASPADQAALEAHLQECGGCRASAEALQAQHADLRRAFAPRRRAAAAVAERVIARLRTQAPVALSTEGRQAGSTEGRQAAPPPSTGATLRVPAPRRPPGKRHFRIPWLPMLLSAAAGFLVAVLVFRPWERAQQPETVTPQVVEKAKERVRLAVTTGAVDVLPPGKDTWQAINGGDLVEVGCKVRTPAQVRCEFRCADDSEVRLNGDTELTFRTGRQLALDRGQILASVSAVAEGERPFQVQMDDASVTALGTQFDLARQPDEAVLTVLQGTTQVEAGGNQEIVKKGQGVKIARGQMTPKYPVKDLVRATRWVHEILVKKGRDNPELEKRVDDLLAQIGDAKMAFLTEPEIRSLGDHCVLPLTRFIQSDRAPQKPELKRRRQEAARILADLAQPWSIPDLIQMLTDQDGKVRFYAASGLQRLTTETQGCNPEDWRNQKKPETQEAWLKWWEENKERFLMSMK
jgi:ferric-dicitrate binding protein FerR (iron transport regulator)